MILIRYRGPGGSRMLFGPRTSAVRVLRGEIPTAVEMLSDMSPLGMWCEGGPLEYRPPELWADLVHDHVYTGEDAS